MRAVIPIVFKRVSVGSSGVNLAVTFNRTSNLPAVRNSSFFLIITYFHHSFEAQRELHLRRAQFTFRQPKQIKLLLNGGFVRERDEDQARRHLCPEWQ